MSKRSGDPCEQPGCGGHLVTYSSRVDGERRVRYLHCKTCQHRPQNNKWVLPLQFTKRCKLRP